MDCPHCDRGFHDVCSWDYLSSDKTYGWLLGHQNCPSCGKIIIEVNRIARHEYEYDVSQSRPASPAGRRSIIYPTNGSIRRNVPSEVPSSLADDFQEAAAVLELSPKASAALSRRCLERVLSDKLLSLRDSADKPTSKKPTLEDLIGKASSKLGLSQSLVNQLHEIRVLGNFAVHTIKDTHSGEIVEVEPGEAEAMLDLLERLFDEVFVKPEGDRKRRAGINDKLIAAGKPPLPD